VAGTPFDKGEFYRSVIKVNFRMSLGPWQREKFYNILGILQLFPLKKGGNGGLLNRNEPKAN
jgi:hypothetical protein